MPRPYDGITFLYCHHGIAAFDMLGFYFKLEVTITCGIMIDSEVLHQVFLVFPNNLSTVDTAISSTVRLFNPRVGDVGSGVVLELMQNKISTVPKDLGGRSSVGRCIVYSVSDGIAIYQRQFVKAGVRDDIAVGRAACSPGVTLDVVHRKVVIIGAAALGVEFKGCVALFE